MSNAPTVGGCGSARSVIPTGQVAFYLHGTGSSRLEVAHFAEAGVRQGVRFVCWDRPGSGGSTDQPGRTLLDVVDDARAVAEAVGADRPVVVGISGGGSHVLALAAAAPDLVRLGVALNPGAPADDAVLADLPGNIRSSIKLARDRPKIYDRIGYLMEGGGGPLGRMLQRAVVPREDLAVVSDPRSAADVRGRVRGGRPPAPGLHQGMPDHLGSALGRPAGGIPGALHVYAGRQDPFLGFSLQLQRAGARLHYLDGGHLAPLRPDSVDEITALIVREGTGAADPPSGRLTPEQIRTGKLPGRRPEHARADLSTGRGGSGMPLPRLQSAPELTWRGMASDRHVQGAVVRGDRTAQGSTTDQRLLESRGTADWVHTDPWRVLRIQSEFVEGFGTLAELGPAISIFGSARTPRDHPAYAQAEDLARRVVEAGLAVITGGGPGIMEAANKGAAEAGGVSVGLGIELPFESGLNPYVNLGINFRYFFARKTMFVKYAQGFAGAAGRLRHPG